MKITSDFAILDVKRGRATLAKRFTDRPSTGLCPLTMRVPVVITGYIDEQHSRDDGVSIEFSVVVEKLEVKF